MTVQYELTPAQLAELNLITNNGQSNFAAGYDLIRTFAGDHLDTGTGTHRSFPRE